MKSSKHILMAVLSVVILLLSATATPVGAKATRIEFTGNEVCGDPIIPNEWMAGITWHANGITSTCYDTASIPELTGIDYLTGFTAQMVGKDFIMFGKLRMESAEGGVWVGSWVFPAHSTAIQVIAHGEGIYEGMELHWFLSLDGPFWGYIIDTGK